MNVPLVNLPPEAAPRRPLAPPLERRRLRLSLALLSLDTSAIFAGLLSAGAIYLGDVLSVTAIRSAILLAPLFLIIGLHNGLYKAEVIFLTKRTITLGVYGIGLSALLMLFVTFYTKSSDEFSRGVVTLGCVLALGFIIGLRLLLSRWVRRRLGASLENTIIIHADGPAIEMKHAYHINAREHFLSSDRNDPDNLHRLGLYIQNMDRVIISCPQEEREKWVPLLRAAGVRGEFVSESIQNLGVLSIQNEPGFSSLVVSVQPLGFEARVIKRVMDLSLASLGLVLLFPLLALVAVLIKLEDGGPIFFRQRRMGQGNRFFWIYKFRSMRVEQSDPNGERSTAKHDDRTTRIGRFMRRTSVDELPQLLNVWLGEMSLVGPRPHALGSQAGSKLFWEVDGRYWNRHALKPGLTGLAQIRGYRGATECERDLIDRLQADLEYVAAWSIWLDLKILLKTLRVVVHDNAY